MFLNLDEYYNYINSLLDKKPGEVLISTYGIYCGILDDGTDVTTFGSKYDKQSKQLCDRLREEKIKTSILVGVYSYRSCKGDFPCENCEKSYAKGMRRLLAHSIHWPEFKWRFSPNCHLKMFLANYKNSSEAVSGGRNMTDSEWADASFPIHDPASNKRLAIYFLNTWKESKVINEDNIAVELVRQINTVKWAGSYEE